MAFLGYRQAPSSSISSILGDALEQSLTQSLQNREFNKVYKNNQNLLEGLGIRKDVANPLSRNAPEEIFKFLKQFGGLDIGNPVPTQNPLDVIGQLLSSNQQFQPQQAQNNQQFQPNQQLLEQQPTNNNNAIKQLFDTYPQLQNKISPEQLGQLIQSQNNNPTVQRPRSNIISKGGDLDTKNYEYAIQRDINKFERPALEQAHKEYVAAEINEKILEREMELVNKGELDNPIFASAIDKLNKGVLGISVDLSSLLSTDSQEFQKLTAQMAENLRTAGAGRVTNLMMENFMKSIPTLMQSDEGKKRVIENYKLFNDIKKSKYLVMRNLIAQNGGKIPENLTFSAAELEPQMLERFQPQLQRFEKEYSQSAKFNTLSEVQKAAKNTNAIGYRNTKTGEIVHFKNKQNV